MELEIEDMIYATLENRDPLRAMLTNDDMIIAEYLMLLSETRHPLKRYTTPRMTRVKLDGNPCARLVRWKTDFFQETMEGLEISLTHACAIVSNLKSMDCVQCL